MNNYDVVVVGAGISGLVSSLTLLSDGYKVLLVDEHTNIGGLNSVIKKGRFEFEPSFHSLYIKETGGEYSINDLFGRLGIENKISFDSIPDVFRVVTINRDENGIRKDYTMPFGIEEFADRLEQYVTGSKESCLRFFELAKECKDGLKYVAKSDGNVDYDLIGDKYPNFVKIGNNSVSKVLDEINMPLEAQEIINACWVYLGSPETEISFVHYATFLYDMVNFKLQVPSLKTSDIIWNIFDKYLELGGDVRFNTKVIKLILDGDKVSGVRLDNGDIIVTNHVITSGNVSDVYNNLIDDKKIVEKGINSISKRHIGARELNVYLGLNRSVKDLGIDNYVHLLYHSLDSDVEFNKMKAVNNGGAVAVCYNVANCDASPKGTCILSLNTLYFDDCYTLALNDDNFFSLKEEVANGLIDSFEKATKINIREYIEEIEIVTPMDIAKYNGALDGSSYGFRYTGLDNLLPRILNRQNEQYVKGLYFVGGFAGDIYSVASAYMSGESEAKRVKEELGGKNVRN